MASEDRLMNAIICVQDLENVKEIQDDLATKFEKAATKLKRSEAHVRFFE